MSSTRTSAGGEFHQERFCSSPEFEGDAINGLAAAKRISIITDRSTRELLWFIQSRSLSKGGLQKLCDELAEFFPQRIGTPTLRVISTERRFVKKAEIDHLRREFELWDRFSDDWSDAPLTKPQAVPQEEWKVDFYRQRVLDEMRELPQLLKNFCLNPKADISAGVWFFEDLFGALATLRERFIAAAKSRLADTIVTRKINETLDFWFARRRMVLIEGVAGIGRTATTRAWCDARAGLARYVEVPSSSDDRSFFASIARELGVARGASFKAQQIKVRVEEMLAASDLMLVFDESQYLWTQLMRPRRTPDRLLWIKSVLDSGTPVALIAHSDFTKWREHYIAKTLWADEQFERRLNRRIVLPSEHSREDMLKIARAHLPEGDQPSWKLLAGYALGTEKKQASGIVEALESARYRAEQDGRTEVTFADIEAALIHEHQFLNAPSAPASQAVCTDVARPVNVRRKAPDSRRRIADFQIAGRLSSDRITASIGVT